jgi:hypothetical protein
MTIHTVKGVLSRTIRPAAPTSDAPVHLVSNAVAFSAAATWIAEICRRAGLSQNYWDDQRITKANVHDLLNESGVELCQETAARMGLIGIMHPDECEFASITE